MSHEKAFGELRSVLQKTPSLRAWYKVCRILERWPQGSLREVALPYFKANIAHSEWAGARRPAPTRWAQSYLAGEKADYFELIDGFDIEGIAVSPHQIARLVASPITQGLVSISLVEAELSHSALDILFSAHLPALRILDLSKNSLGGAIHELPKASFRAQLEQLRLRDSEFENEDLENLLRERFDHLELLDLRSNRLGEKGIDLLSGNKNLPALRALGLSDNTNIPETCDMGELTNIIYSHFPSAPDDFEVF